MTGHLDGAAVFMTGGSRGIGLAIAEKLAAEHGARVALFAKTAEPHPRLPGTLHTAAAAIEAAGGQALPIQGDLRDAEAVQAAVAQAAEAFGGIDVCINNASAIDLRPVEELPVKNYDLLQAVNARGTYAATQACLPHLRRSAVGHVLTLSPPLNADPRWFRHAAYTISKYGMTIVTLGVAEALRGEGVAANCLWPQTAIATAAVQNLLGGEEAMAGSRTPALVADAAVAVLSRPAADCTGNAYICEDVLAQEGVTDLEPYAFVPGTTQFLPDFFLDHDTFVTAT
jgi:citronellol/citronellal dehydrogenase